MAFHKTPFSFENESVFDENTDKNIFP